MTAVDGGSTYNDLIPDSAVIAGTFRAYSKQSFYGLRKRIEEVTFLISLEISFQFNDSYGSISAFKRFCVLGYCSSGGSAQMLH